MNQVDVFVDEIIEPPKQVVTDDFCGWVVKIRTVCYGHKKEAVKTATTKEAIERYKVGYSWLE